MKAWLVSTKDESRSTVVFAENRGRAKAVAMCTDTCEGESFVDIRALRAPRMDKYYRKGKTEMDWNDPKDRIVMVKELNFYCEDFDVETCEKCSAKNFCDYYKDYAGL